MVNKCSKCKKTFEEKELELSHDIPRYVGGLDSDGRHFLCKKCHDIYEKTICAVMTKWLPENIKREMRHKAEEFSKRYFNG